MTVSVKFVVRSGVEPTVVSSTLTVTLYDDFISKSRTVPALSRSSVPTISKNVASAPARESAFVPSASSVTTMSASLIAAAVLVFSASVVVVVFCSATAVGASLTSVTLIVNDLSNIRPSKSVTRTVTV